MASVHSIPVTPELHMQIGQLAQTLGKSESEVVREAVEAYCQEQGVQPRPGLSNDALIEKADRYPPPQQWCRGVAVASVDRHRPR